MTALGRGGRKEHCRGQEEVGCAVALAGLRRQEEVGTALRLGGGWVQFGAQMGNALLMAGKHRAAKAKKRWR